MKLRQILDNDYFKLFVKREGKVVLGKRYANMWLLCGVLFVTFMAIAFSNASLEYLDYKMNDPFINWVDIKNGFGADDFVGFTESVQHEAVKEEYHINNHQTDKYNYPLYATATNDSRNLSCRYFADIQTPLVHAILDKDNVIGGHAIQLDKLDNESYGVIITQDALMNKLGYKEIPAFINYRAVCDFEAEEYGAEVLQGGRSWFANVPVPVLAVVKRLPTNMDIIGTKYFYLQETAATFNLCEPLYFSSFVYYLPKQVDVDEFMADLEQCTNEFTDLSYYTNNNEQMPRMEGHAEGTFVSLKFDYEEDVDFAENKQIHDALMTQYAKKGVCRVYEYMDNIAVEDPDDYISIHFNDLNKIGAFQEFAKESFKIDIEMSQINAKENFNEVSIMANILSWTMIVFAIICIILFIVNLLQSYFQKVKRNLGTFKAFGMGNKDLISVYVLIMMVTICAAILIALCATLFLQELLPLLGIAKDDIYGYLALWNGKTLGAVVIILAASVCTVYAVMARLLKDTPGDLIYDR